MKILAEPRKCSNGKALAPLALLPQPFDMELDGVSDQVQHLIARLPRSRESHEARSAESHAYNCAEGGFGATGFGASGVQSSPGLMKRLVSSLYCLS